MTERITAAQFHASEGIGDWRVLFGGAYALFRTGSFAKGLALVDAIGALADAANHHPDVDLRYPTVAVHLVTHDVGGLSARDVALARQISGAARDLDVAADPSAVQVIQVGIDAMVSAEVLPFWEAVLGYRVRDEVELVDPYGRWPRFWFQKMDGPRTGRNRIHIDVSVPHDQAESRIAAAVAAGGRVVYQAEAPAFWTLADAEGNEVDIATWQGREG
jgi:4a-hydroxytetrahydrobiopterin dehydratase